MSASPAFVIDASALLAFLQDEPGSGEVEKALGRGAAMSAANWAEVLSKLADAGKSPDAIAERLAAEGLLGAALAIVPLDESAALEIARLRPKTRRLGLSLGDRACLALGKSLGLPVLTTDGAWRKLKVKGVEVTAVR